MAKADRRLARMANPLSAVLNADPMPATELSRQDFQPAPIQSSPAPTPRKRPPQKKETASKSTRAPSRERTSMIGGHFPPEAKRQLGLIAVEKDTTKQALLEEALNLLFQAYGKKMIDFESVKADRKD